MSLAHIVIRNIDDLIMFRLPDQERILSPNLDNTIIKRHKLSLTLS